MIHMDYCLDTAEPIGLKRLMARPVANTQLLPKKNMKKMKKFMQMTKKLKKKKKIKKSIIQLLIILQKNIFIFIMLFFGSFIIICVY